MKISPIVLFVYNRPWHTRQTIEALQKNELSSESELFIYADGAKSSKTVNKVMQVRKYIETISGFKKVTIIERDKNWGLADSIIEGVTSIINKYGRIIVLEDDIVTSPYFLSFMNEALEFYQNEEKVWHISGWNYPATFNSNCDVYLYRSMNCWGWATWSDNWNFFEKNTDKLVGDFSKTDIDRFNLDGANNWWQQVILNKRRIINTWAIYWYATIFKKNGLCLNPVHSFVKNIGFDGGGIHCNDDSYQDNKVLNNKSVINFNIVIDENSNMVAQIQNYLRKQNKNIVVRVINKISRMFFGRRLIK